VIVPRSADTSKIGLPGTRGDYAGLSRVGGAAKGRSPTTTETSGLPADIAYTRVMSQRTIDSITAAMLLLALPLGTAALAVRSPESVQDVGKGFFTVNWSSMGCPSCRSSVQTTSQPASSAAATISES